MSNNVLRAVKPDSVDSHRGIFQVTLLLYCYLSFVTPPSGPLEIVDVLRVTDWQRLVQLCANATDDSRPSPDYLSTPEERYVAFGTSSIHVHGFIDGKEKMLDIVR